MKNTIVSASLFLSMILALSIASAENQFVINNYTNECASFLSGDNYTQYILPENWTIVEPTPDNMTLECELLNYTYIGELTNLTKICISNCTEGTVLNETTCMCDLVELNETNVTVYYCYGVGALMIPIPNATCNQYNSTNGTPLLGAQCFYTLTECEESLANATVNETINQTNQTTNETVNITENQTANQTTEKQTISIPSINLKERFSDPYVLLALGIIAVGIAVLAIIRKRKQAEHAANFEFPPRL